MVYADTTRANRELGWKADTSLEQTLFTAWSWKRLLTAANNLVDNEKDHSDHGGAGFIGSHVVRLFVTRYPDYLIVNLDKLTYAGNLENLKDIESKPNYRFVKADIVNAAEIQQLFRDYDFDGIIHLAAESHVDRSITNPMEFIQTNIIALPIC